MLLRLFALFTIVPLIELAGLVWLSDKISLSATLILIVATGLAGAWLLRHQGWQTLRRVQADLSAGRVPADALLDGVLMMVAGVLLISPGFVTDLAAILLLVPATRKLCKIGLTRWLANRLMFVGTSQSRFAGTTGSGFAANGFPPRRPANFSHDKVIEARVIHTDSPKN